MFVVIIEFTLRPRFRVRFVERVRRQARDSLGREKDCRVFDICADSLAENRVLLYEVYTDEAAFEAHLATSHFRDFEHAVEGWVDAKKIDRLTRIES